MSFYGYLFVNFCSYGGLPGAQKYFKNNPHNIVEGFCLACAHGHLLVAQWLLQKENGIIDITDYDWAFRNACENRHLEVAKWLFQVSKEKGQEIDISVINEFAFIYACKYEHLHVAQWLQQMKPYLYELEYDEYANIKSYRIRAKEEANFPPLGKVEPNTS
jgi:hypothetical protein